MYDAPLEHGVNWRVIRVRLFLEGHSFNEIDKMGLRDIGDVMGYWAGMAKAEEKAKKKASNQRQQQARRRGRK